MRGPLTHLDLQIMVNLARRPSHGYELMRDIAALSEGRIKAGPGSLYVAISRLVQAGLVKEVTPLRAAPRPRRTYAITSSGISVMEDELARLQRIVMQATKEGWLPTPTVAAALS